MTEQTAEIQSQETTTTATEESTPIQQESQDIPTAQSRRLADLARRERQRVEAETRFKQERESWESTRKQYDPILEAVQQFKSNPSDAEAAFKLLEASGISYEELTDRILSKHQWQEQEEDKPLTLADIERIAEEKAQKLLEQKEQQRLQALEEAQQQELIDAFKKSIEQEANREGTDYRFINNTEGSFDLVFDLVVNYYEQYQEVLPLETAFKEVESQLKSDYDTLISKYSGKGKQSEPAEIKPAASLNFQLPQETKPQQEIVATYTNIVPRKERVIASVEEDSKEALLNKLIGQFK